MTILLKYFDYKQTISNESTNISVNIQMSINHQINIYL